MIHHGMAHKLQRHRDIAALVVLAAWCIVTSMPRSAAAEEDDSSAMVTKQLIKSRCVKCHGPDKQEGDVRLDDLPADVSRDFLRWTRVRDQLREGLMPPEKEPGIERDELNVVVGCPTGPPHLNLSA